MHGTGDATALRGESVSREELDSSRHVQARDPRDGLVPKRTQLEHPLRHGRQRRGWLRARMQSQKKQWSPRAVATEHGRAVEQLTTGVVGVVDDEQGRALALLRTPDRRARVTGLGAGAGVEDGHPPPQRLPSQFGSQASLADAARAGNEHHAAAPLAGFGEQRDQLGQLPIPACQQRRAAIELRRELLRAEAPHQERGPARGLRHAGPGAPHRARPRSPRQACCAPHGRPRAPRPGGRSGTGRASAGRAGARGAAARPRPLRAPRPGPRAARAPARPRRALRTPPSASPPGGRSRSA